MSDLFDKLGEEFKEGTNVFFDDDSIEMRKTLQYYESLIDKLNYQLFVANKKFKEKLTEYRKHVGLPVKEDTNG